MKKQLSLLLCLALVLGLLAACGGAPGEPDAPVSDDPGTKLRIVTTIFPIYDWVENLLGDDAVHAEVSMLLDTGVDLHSYQPTVDDIVKISTCDMFIYVGGESDAWVSDALSTAGRSDLTILCLMDLLGDRAKEEELVEGMEPEEEDEDDEEGPEYDEHVWLSLKNARLFCAAITEALSQADADCADHYAANLAAYDEKLADLDRAYAAMTADAACGTVLFGDRFPFRYLTDDYGLSYYATFSGCSAETEASFETIVFLAGKVDELGLPAVLTIEGTDHRIAETIAETAVSDPAILVLDSMQSVTAANVAAGADYLSLMRENLTALTQALNGA